MVFFHTAVGANDGAGAQYVTAIYIVFILVKYVVYRGEEKVENEVLIANAWPEDVWFFDIKCPYLAVIILLRFHVDDFSSAHIYLRLPQSMTIDTIPAGKIASL
jgi:hypothetical protein